MRRRVRTILLTVAALPAALVWAWVTFYIGFGGTHEVIPGYTCSPTWKFGYECTAPNGDTFGERR